MLGVLLLLKLLLLLLGVRLSLSVRHDLILGMAVIHNRVSTLYDALSALLSSPLVSSRPRSLSLSLSLLDLSAGLSLFARCLFRFATSAWRLILYDPRFGCAVRFESRVDASSA
uniref:Secreted protein n=1 Tax=Odontella aurita TaxID=265563 RepID=A0A7S4I2L9_9STRA